MSCRGNSMLVKNGLFILLYIKNMSNNSCGVMSRGSREGGACLVQQVVACCVGECGFS